MLIHLLITNWKIFEIIISNKNLKFMFDLWQIIFIKFKIKLLINIVWHFQINDNSKKINQTIEIALKYLIIVFFDIDWKLFLFVLQIQLNNSFNVAIELTFNEIIYDFKTWKLFFVVVIAIIDESQMSNDIFNQKLKYQQKIVDVIVFVNVKIKIYYDVHHQFILFNSNDKIYLRLHHEYQLSNKFNKKMFNQRCESFIIKRRIDRLIYELNLFVHWRIYSIISIIQLKFYFNESNSYNHFKSNYFDFVKMKSDIDDWKFYTMKRIANKRLRKFERIIVIQYLMKWKNYDSKFNEWKSLFYLNNCLKLMKKFEYRQTAKNVVDITKFSTNFVVDIWLSSSISILIFVKKKREWLKKIVIDWNQLKKNLQKNFRKWILKKINIWYD